jgi:hypothetical protein
MRFRLASLLAFGLCLMLTGSVFAQTEDELVSKFFKQAEKQKTKKVGFLVVNGSFGRLFRDNDYNKFTNRVTPLVSDVSSGTGEVEKINSSMELFGGFGMMTSARSSASFGFSYWLKQGSNQTGDFNLSLVNLDDPNDHYGFDLKSEVQVYGFAGQIEHYLLGSPDNKGKLHQMAVKIGGGAGYYFASWQLWDGFTGFNLSTGEPETIDAKLTGSSPGFTGLVAAEFPVKVAGLVLEGSLRYLQLNFTNMRWYNSNNEETVATVNSSGTRVNLNMSGPRAQLGFKRYFSW